ncbi:MAG: type III pantothenate kinase [Acidobacteria bacterium]|nr:type III pantothenate kinase [Acidobacteriota bacterium]MBA3887044.1 type III pantothenate kinase [Acidobacteriota bacterium]
MLLAIDVGNTNVTIGVFDGQDLAHNWRLASMRERTADELGIFVTRLLEQTRIDAASLSGIAIASVVPTLTRPMEEMCERYFARKALLVDAANAGMPIRYTPAGDVGADRIVNAVAAWEQYGRELQVPLIVVDFGTGTTFDVISRGREYLGGVICPGIGISADALFQRAARLPRVDIKKPASVIGQSTVDAIQAGLFFGYVEMVDGLVRRIRGELEQGDQAVVIATGGLAGVIADETTSIRHVAPDLTLHGLRLIWDSNQAGG